MAKAKALNCLIEALTASRSVYHSYKLKLCVSSCHIFIDPAIIVRDHREWRKKVCTSTTNVHKGGVQTQHSMIAMQPESLAMPDSLRLHGRMRRMSRLKSLRQHWSRGTFHR